MKREERLTVMLAIDVESDIEDDELLEIHAAEVIRKAVSQEIGARRIVVASSAKANTSVRLAGIYEGVIARLVREV